MYVYIYTFIYTYIYIHVLYIELHSSWFLKDRIFRWGRIPTSWQGAKRSGLLHCTP